MLHIKIFYRRREAKKERGHYGWWLSVLFSLYLLYDTPHSALNFVRLRIFNATYQTQTKSCIRRAGTCQCHYVKFMPALYPPFPPREVPYTVKFRTSALPSSSQYYRQNGAGCFPRMAPKFKMVPATFSCQKKAECTWTSSEVFWFSFVARRITTATSKHKKNKGRAIRLQEA